VGGGRREQCREMIRNPIRLSAGEGRHNHTKTTWLAGLRTPFVQMSRIQELLTWPTYHRGPFFCIVGLYARITNYIINSRAYASRDKPVEPDERRLVALVFAGWTPEPPTGTLRTARPSPFSPGKNGDTAGEHGILGPRGAATFVTHAGYLVVAFIHHGKSMSRSPAACNRGDYNELNIDSKTVLGLHLRLPI